MNISSGFVINLVQFIGGIAVLIFVHELGHFLAARFFKVDVEEFGIGFPPRLLTLFESKGTRFSLNWIPLGGFVRLKGENDPEVPGGLGAANPWVRLGVIFAGPLTNILVGVVLAVFLFYHMGEPVLDRVQVQFVSPQSPAQSAGLQNGDIIINFAGQDIQTTDQLHNAIYSHLGEAESMTFQRGNQTKTVTITPRNPASPDEGAIGILMGYETRPTTWIKAIPRGISASFEYTKAIFLLPINLFQGSVTPAEARPVGYKGMFDIYQQVGNPLWFFTMITLSLGIFNLFPIPALDGGRILLTLPEIVIRRRVPPQYENMIHLIGFTVLLLLLIYINLQDFINPVRLPF
jgi:regulator of sigma E protease